MNTATDNDAPATNHDDIGASDQHLQTGPARQWPRQDIVKDKMMRFAQAYLMMARAG
jgi:hypothetical protein